MNVQRNNCIQRHNLILVCKLAIKTLVDKSSIGPVEEDSPEVENFLAILEHLLNHRIKCQQGWFGNEESANFWEFVRKACIRVPNSCIRNVHGIEKPSTSRGKGRAWLRFVLMEKRLSEYLSVSIQQTKLRKRFYNDGAVMLSDEIAEVCGALLGLNAIDFSFDLKTKDLDYNMTPPIDFTPFLKFQLSALGAHNDAQEFLMLKSKRDDFPNATGSPKSLMQELTDADQPNKLEECYDNLLKKHKVVAEQKGYLEELLHLREKEICESQRQKEKLVETMKQYEAEARKERMQLESVILELHSQMATMKVEHISQSQQVRHLMERYMPQIPKIDEPGFALEEISCTRDNPHDLSSKSPTTSEVNKRPSSPEVRISRARSEDSQSMVPLAGSFTSESSLRQEHPSDPIGAAGQSPPIDSATEVTPASHEDCVTDESKEATLSSTSDLNHESDGDETGDDSPPSPT